MDKIKKALSQLRSGGMVVLVDDKDRENEGDVIFAAEKTTSDKINFLMKEARGLICVALCPEIAKRVSLPLMNPWGEDRHGTQFLASVDVKLGITTGISASDRAKTIQKLITKGSTLADFFTPGHVFPLLSRPGGVMERRGHTEASVDLTRAAGLIKAAVICEIADDSGEMAKGKKLVEFAKRHNLPVLSVPDVVTWRVRNEVLIKLEAETVLPTELGEFTVQVYSFLGNTAPIVVLKKGEVGNAQGVITRVHSECLTGDLFFSRKCDCGNQLLIAMEKVAAANEGLIIYLPQEGRGIGLVNKIRAYQLQEKGLDTVEANLALGFPADARDYAAASQVLKYLKVRSVKLLTNNPNKVETLKNYGVHVVERVSIIAPLDTKHLRYLQTKKEKLGHVLGPLMSITTNHHVCPRCIPSSLHIIDQHYVNNAI